MPRKIPPDQQPAPTVPAVTPPAEIPPGIVSPEENPDLIPDEDPFETTPYELPQPGEAPDTS